MTGLIGTLKVKGRMRIPFDEHFNSAITPAYRAVEAATSTLAEWNLVVANNLRWGTHLEGVLKRRWD